MSSSSMVENSPQVKTCQRMESEKIVSYTKSSESSDEQPETSPNSQILKSGPLFLSSKGIGWTSWKKRWFVLTGESLVFYRTDPNALPQKGSEANPILGGIDLNNAGCVNVKADRKLLTVFFPDGRGGRTFTLKGETVEELQEWKTALDNAMTKAPNAALPVGHNETTDSVESSTNQFQDKNVQSTVVGRPVEFALEEADGSPAFLEKALCFIEEYGLRVEGILRLSADVEEVLRRIREYEEGKTEFSSDEDGHVIGDCIKYLLRELPSGAVPAASCTALVEAYKIDRGNRVNAIRAAIAETLPEPNLLLLERCLKMMRVVATQKSVNRMSFSALAACMAPLLMRPLLVGECEFEDDFNMGGDGSLQLLKAAAAANHAQAIIMIMLEEYESIFDEELSEDGSYSSEIYSESEEDGIEYDGSSDEDDVEDDGYHDADNALHAENGDDSEHSSHSCSGSFSGSGSSVGSDISENENEDYDSEHSSDHSSNQSSAHSSDQGSYHSSDHSSAYHSDSISSGDAGDIKATKKPSSTSMATTLVQNVKKPFSSVTSIPITALPITSLPMKTRKKKDGALLQKNNDSPASPHKKANAIRDDAPTSSNMQTAKHTSSGSHRKPGNRSDGTSSSMRQPTRWSGNSGRKKVPVKSTDDESTGLALAIQELETTKTDLKSKIAKEVEGNAVLQSRLERKKEALYERRLLLEKDVEILQEQLQKKKELKASLEAGLMNMRPGHASITSNMDDKTKEDIKEINLAEADITNLKEKVTGLEGRLSHHRQTLCQSCKRKLDTKEMQLEKSDNALVDQHEKSSSDNVPVKTKDGKTKIETTTPQPLESSSMSSNEVPPATTLRASENSTPRGQDSTCGAEKKKHRSKTKSSHSSKDQKPSENPSQGDIAMPVAYESSSKMPGSNSENPKSGSDVDAEDGKSQKHNSQTDSTSSQKAPRRMKSRSRTRSVDTPSTEEAMPVARLSSPIKSSSNGENNKSGTDMDSEDSKTVKHDSTTLTEPQSSHKVSRRTKTRKSRSKDESATEPPPVTCDASEKFASTGEIPKGGADSDVEYTKAAEKQSSPTMADPESPEKVMKKSKTKSKGSSSKEEPVPLARNRASKKSFLKIDSSKKEVKEVDGPSLSSSSRQSSQKYRSEDAAPSNSSALTRLSNRLNFLKERRAQLASEVQNLDANRVLNPKPPHRTSSRSGAT